MTPRHSGTLFTTYQLTPAAADRRRPERAQLADAEPQPARASSRRASSPATCWPSTRSTPQIAFKFNVINVTNKLYADSLYTGHYIPGQPRTVLRDDDGALLNRRRYPPPMLLHVAPGPDADELRAACARRSPARPGATAAPPRARSRRRRRTTSSCAQGRRRAARRCSRSCCAALNRHAMFFSAALPQADLAADVQPLRAARPTPSATTSTTPSATSPAARASGCAPTSAARCSSPSRTSTTAASWSIEDTYGAQRVKLPAGDMVLYPGTSVHRVEPVTRGARAGELLLGREHGAQRRAAHACCTTWTGT